MKLENDYQQFLETNLYPRKLKSLEPIQGFSSIYLQHQGKKFINFSSSDYLGLANHPTLIARSQHYAERYGVGASASRLVTGNYAYYSELEEKLAHAIGKPAALILGSGYQTNISVLEALLDRQVLGQEALVFCDKLCHASIVTAVRHAAEMHRFQHNDLTHLHTLLKKYAKPQRKIFIIVESVYSMEGDTANLAEIIQLAAEYNACLYVDDAHAVGLYGKNGWGMATEFAEHIPIIMGTFSKGLGSFGGYIACSALMKNYLVNKCRGLIYSTALSPAVIGAIDAAIELLPSLTKEREKVMQHAARLKEFFQQEKINFGGANTHIIPWIVGDAKLTLHLSAMLEEQGILGTAIQPPTVPVGKSRIRFCLTAAHTDEDVAKLMESIKQVANLDPLNKK